MFPKTDDEQCSVKLSKIVWRCIWAWWVGGCWNQPKGQSAEELRGRWTYLHVILDAKTTTQAWCTC